MGSIPDPGVVIDGDSFTGGDFVQPSFDEFQRQTSLMTSCTLLWKELSDHFTELERDLLKKSESIKRKIEDLDQETKESLDELQNREVTIDKSVAIAVGRIEQSKAAYEKVFVLGGDGEVDDSEGLLMNLNKFCLKMDSSGFWGFITLRKKELDLMRTQIPLALSECMDPARFALEAISEVFPVDKRVESSEMSNDLGWACVLVLESLIPVVVDPVIGKSRLLVTPSVKKRAKEIAETWKESLDQRGGIENVKTPDVHTFLQHLVTFGIVKKEDVDLYRKLVVGSAWRKQMPKLAVSLGLGDKMADMIEELIARKQQLDAVHFTYEVGLVHMFPPVPLLKAYLKDAKKATSSISEDRNHSGRVVNLTGRKEQSALRAVIKCIEEYKLEAEFPPEPLKKRLEQLEKVRSAEKRKPVTLPANKRTRASNGGPMMPPAKAGRLTTNAYVSSFPTAPTFARSPSHGHYPTPPSYPYDRSTPPSMYGSLSPQTNPYTYSPEASAPSSMYGSLSPQTNPYTYSPEASAPSSMYGSLSPQTNPYTYSPEASAPPSMYGSISPQANRYVYSPEVAPPPFAGSYSMAPPPPLGYPTYGGYGNAMAPAYHHHAYY